MLASVGSVVLLGNDWRSATDAENGFPAGITETMRSERWQVQPPRVPSVIEPGDRVEMYRLSLLGMNLSEAPKRIADEGFAPVTVPEGVAFAKAYPEVFPDKTFLLLGSSLGEGNDRLYAQIFEKRWNVDVARGDGRIHRVQRTGRGLGTKPARTWYEPWMEFLVIPLPKS